MNSFGPQYRLKSAQDFSYLKTDSQLLKSKWLRFYFKKSKDESELTRVGFSVSKKVGCAGRRNRVKRLLREQFRNSEWKLLGKDILIVVSPFLYKQHNDEASAEVSLLESCQILFSKLSKNEAL